MSFKATTVPLELALFGRGLPDWKVEDYGLMRGVLPLSPVKVNTPIEKISLISMGDSRLRISNFPVAETKRLKLAFYGA